MRRQRSLSKLQQSFDFRIRRLETLCASIKPGLKETDRYVSYAALESLNAWTCFVREFYLSCGVLQARTITGVVAAPTNLSLADERQAILHAIGLLRPPPIFARANASAVISSRDEPTWHEISVILKLSASLGLTNNNSVIQALAYPTTFFRDMPVIRNFFAHRNMSTAEKVSAIALKHYQMPNLKCATDFLRSLLPGRPETVLAEWLTDLRLISDEMCQ